MNVKRHPFDMLMELEGPDIRLDCAALQLARDAHPSLDIRGYLGRLDEIAEAIIAARAGRDLKNRYLAMREILVEEFDLRGNDDDFLDPENSYLNTVLDSGRGIPISLSVIWIEVARRLKWAVSGVGLPGHFLVRFEDDSRIILADPFNEGRCLSLEDCKRLLDEQFDGKVPFSTQFLEPVDTRTILARMLGNLRSVYLARQQWDRLTSVLERLCAVEPTNGRHMQELAAVRYRVGDLRGAYARLHVYLHLWPTAEDAPAVRSNLHHVEAAIAALN